VSQELAFKCTLYLREQKVMTENYVLEAITLGHLVHLLFQFHRQKHQKKFWQNLTSVISQHLFIVMLNIPMEIQQFLGNVNALGNLLVLLIARSRVKLTITANLLFISQQQKNLNFAIQMWLHTSCLQNGKHAPQTQI
jgi:hypothetical protein